MRLKSLLCERISSTIPKPDLYMKPIARRATAKKFLEEHREEITLHKAAKQAFDTPELQKIPRIKELSKEYAEVLSEKKRFSDSMALVLAALRPI